VSGWRGVALVKARFIIAKRPLVVVSCQEKGQKVLPEDGIGLAGTYQIISGCYLYLYLSVKILRIACLTLLPSHPSPCSKLWLGHTNFEVPKLLLDVDHLISTMLEAMEVWILTSNKTFISSTSVTSQ
jgi:hypothetical protein